MQKYAENQYDLPVYYCVYFKDNIEKLHHLSELSPIINQNLGKGDAIKCKFNNRGMKWHKSCLLNHNSNKFEITH